MTRSRTAVVLGTLFLALTLLAGCTSESPGGGGPTADAPPKAKLVASPAVDAKDVPPTEPVTVSVTEGTLDSVEVKNDGGKPIKGEIAPDKLTWKSTEVLGYAKKYTYEASATGTDGKKVELKGTFTTLKPAKTPRATVNPGDNATVGVAMPIRDRKSVV